jgi:peptide/nickel transport system ATP-binding protein
MTPEAAEADAVVAVSGLGIGLPAGGDRDWAVRGVTLEVRAGETLCLVGESGSGKSVVAQAIMGMLPRALPLREGRIALQGAALPPQRDAAYNRLRGPKMAMVFQDAAASLDPVQRAGHQLEEILEVHGVPRSERRARVMDMLRAVRLAEPERIYRAYPHQMSGGQAQRIVIAGALLLNPALLIADEPTTALDVTTQAEILALIATLRRERGASVLFITHDMGVVAQIADRIAVMKDGEIVETGTAAEVLDRPQHAYTRKLLDAAGHRADRPGAATSETLLEARGVSLVYRSGSFLARREVAAVRDVSLDLGRGQTVAVVGESGSGKSSLARCLLRLEDVAAGTIRFRGRDVTHLKGRELRELRKKIQVVLQDPFGALDPRQTIRSTIAEGPVIHGAARAAANARAEELLDLVGLTPQAADRYPHEFSGGQRQRICIARALALDPEVLIADEAVSALDVSIQAQILDLFAGLQARLGFAMVFITHDLRVAAAIADRVIVMKDGRVVEQGPVREVFETPREPYTRALIEAAPGRGKGLAA